MQNLVYDIIIKNGKIVNGTGNPWFPAEIGIIDGKIYKISSKIKAETKKEINAIGLVVCPGFIDIHSHSDYSIPFNSLIESSIRQGITTSVCGVCGQGLAPIPKEREQILRDYIKTTLPTMNDFQITWSTFSEYLNRMESLNNPANLAFFVGLGTIRLAGGPCFENRQASDQELAVMKNLIIEAMEAGAFGLSTGLTQLGQIYASKNEIIELLKDTVVPFNGLYCSHVRGEGSTIVEAVKEFIEITEKSGCIGGQLSHLKIMGKKNWEKHSEVLRLIHDANDRNLSISYDQYPYSRGMAEIIQVLPPWVCEKGITPMIERLHDPSIRKRIQLEMSSNSDEWESYIYSCGFENIYLSIAQSEQWIPYIGKNIVEITDLKKYCDNWKTLFEIIIDEKGLASITLEFGSDIKEIMKNPYQMVGSDSFGIPLDPNLGAVHPRSFGTYPRILGKYVREEKHLLLEDAIRRMTSFPAQRLGLQDRGVLYEGTWADIVIFNPDTVIDESTYNQPYQYPKGIEHVIVNGEMVVENNHQLKTFPGKVLRRK